MFYTIINDTLTSGKITFSSQTEDANPIAIERSIKLNAGNTCQTVSTCFENGQEPDVLKISSDVLTALSIPTDIPYQLIFTVNGLRIGPVIGLLMYKKSKAMTKKSLCHLLNYTLLYKKMGGLLYVFSVEGICLDAGMVEGFFYNYSNERWEKGLFPLPDAIYRRVSIPKKTMDGLYKHIGNRIFNAVNFNKLDYWNLASTSKSVTRHLPMTRKYTSFHDIDLMFESFNVLILKTVDGLRAFGLIKLIKDKNQYFFQRKLDDNPVLITDKEEAVKYFQEIKMNRNYIIQQAVDLLKIENRYVDFRVVMQKDHTMDWQCTGIITSIGKQGGVCSNYAEDDLYMTFEAFFEKYMSLDKKDVFKKRNEIIDISKKACMVLDKSGINCIDLGVDIGLDKNLKPWIFELNNRAHFHPIALFIDDYDMYFRIKANPIIYMVKLSGFSID